MCSEQSATGKRIVAIPVATRRYPSVLPSGKTESKLITRMALSGQRQSWKTPGELGVTKSVECDIFPFSALTL